MASLRCLPSQVSLLVLWTWAGFCLTGVAWGKEERSPSLPLLAQPGHVLLLRHAQAPGVGDPSGFVLGDCATQRNLDDVGRAQAKALGERLRAAGITQARIYSSQWCRCRETARLLALGPVEELPALNSFFNQPEAKGQRLAALRVVLNELPRNGPLVVLVTHQTTITALTDYYPASGEGVVLKLREDGGFERAADFPATD